MKKLLLFVFFFIHFCVTAQKYQLGSVTIDELNEKVHPIDTAAVAAIIFNKGDVSVELDRYGYAHVKYTFEMKMKIYKKEGFDYANFEKFYFGEKGTNNLTFSETATYNLVDGAIVKSKVGSDGIFVTQERQYRQSKRIAFPNVKEGSIIEFRYTLHSLQYYKLEDFYFQYEIPVNYVQYIVTSPGKFLYNKALYGFLKLNQTDVKMNLENGAKTIYSFANVPAMKGERFVNNINNYRGRMTYELASELKKYGGVQNYATNWETIVKNIYRDEDFSEQLKITNYFKDDVELLLQGLTTNDEKMKAIFNYVKTRMNWNKYDGYSCDLGVKKAYKEKKGNTADINLMLVAMLRYANLKANPIVISTRGNGISLFPSIIAFNHVIVGVEVGADIILLDATDKNTYIDIVPIRDLNWTGRIIKSETLSEEVDLMPKMLSKDIVNAIVTIQEDGTVEGKIKEQYFDYDGYVFRNVYNDLPTDKQIEELEKQYKGIEISNYEISNKTELEKPAIQNYSFNHNNCVEIIGNKMYFSPLLFFALTESPFKQDTREYPIDFAYPNQDKYLITIAIPNGYVVETLPQSVSIPMSGNKGTLKYMIANTDKQIQFSMTLDINSAIIAAEYYVELKSFFAELVKKQTEKVVLKKI